MDDVSHWLLAAGLDATSIHRENFAPVRADVPANGERRFSLHVPAFGKSAEFAVGELLLDVLEREGLPIIGACRTGVCGSCKCKVVEGEVETTSSLPLTPEEIEAGYVPDLQRKSEEQPVPPSGIAGDYPSVPIGVEKPSR